MPGTKPDAYQVICVEPLAEVIRPLIPEAENVFGAVQLEVLSADQCHARILAGNVDAWFTLENASGLDHLLRSYEDSPDEELPEFYAWNRVQELDPGKTLFLYEVFQIGTKESQIEEWVNALKVAGLKERFTEYGYSYPVWEKGYDAQLAFMNSIVIETLKYKQADVNELISMLWKKGQEKTTTAHFPDLRVEIFKETPPVTLELRNVTFLDSLKIVTEISGLYFRVDGNEIVIENFPGGVEPIKVYRLPTEKVDLFLNAFESKYSLRGRSTHDPYYSAGPEPPITDVEKLQLSAGLTGIYDVTIDEYDRTSEILIVKGLGADKPKFKQFLRQICFYPATLQEVSWNRKQ